MTILRAALRDTITVFGNYGELEVDIETGEVVNYEPDLDESEHPRGEYHDIVSVRVDDIKRLGLTPGDSVDILFVGLTNDAGRFDPPCLMPHPTIEGESIDFHPDLI